MLWKIIACSFVILSTQILGISYAQNMTCILFHLQQQKKMLVYMSGEIRYLHRPVLEILEGMKSIISEPYLSLLNQVILQMEQNHTLKNSWMQQVEKMETAKDYPKVALQFLSRFPDFMIYDGSQNMLESMHLFLDELEEEMQKIKEQKRTKSRLLYLLNSMFGLLIIIIFI